ncbi:MAG TPA: PIN domain-containing protein [Terriglobia bacterium]|nr:PIN domain-containing protein [Terriglobia bacterium]
MTFTNLRSAVRIRFNLKLPLADSVVLATARAHGALLWTQDADFKGIDKVKYLPKRA